VRKGLVFAVILHNHSLLFFHTQSSSYQKRLYASSLLYMWVDEPTIDSHDRFPAVEVFRV
jgi:hypothetical protein